jgi:hypothetical protein
MKEQAIQYRNAGLSVLPANPQLKFAALPQWKQYQLRLPTETEVQGWFGNSQSGLCIVTGAVSGNLEMIDFDLQAELFEAWQQRVKEAAPDVLPRLVIETSQSGGRHVIYRCDSQICGNLKLAQRKISFSSGDEVVIGGKTCRPRQDKEGNWHVILTLIETRGQGGLFLCAPTPGYALLQGDLTTLPVLTAPERELLLEAAWSLNEYIPEPEATPQAVIPTDTLRPGDDYNARGDVRALLQSHGWTCVKCGENEYWRRPGKTSGWSASLKNGVFYVWSTNAQPFEHEKAYSPFSVYALLEHGGDFSKAAAELGKQGYGQNPVGSDEVDLSGIVSESEDVPHDLPGELVDPGAFPESLLRIPGFVSELMDFGMESAPYPNLGLIFCGALAMQSFLCGRKVRDSGNLRTNLYLLALAGASSGKDWARQMNAHIMLEINKIESLGDKFASGEAIQDAMFLTPNMLFQNDEIDGMLISLNKARDARFESIMGTMLTMFTSSGSIYPMRRKAGKESGGIIDQPHLTIFGTATPKYYYESLSERMLCNGFFARMIVVDIGYRGKGKDAGLVETMPSRILETAQWWDSLCPGEQRGNLSHFHPVPMVVAATPEGRDVLDAFRSQADEEYAKAEVHDHEAAKAIWGRANENARKLALLYACSENNKAPQISLPAASWAVQFVNHQVRRMLYLAGQHVFENEFDKKCQRMMQYLTVWKRQKGNQAWMPHWELARRLKGWSEKDFELVRDSLLARMQIEFEVGSTPKRGRIGCRYRIR